MRLSVVAVFALSAIHPAAGVEPKSPADVEFVDVGEDLSFVGSAQAEEDDDGWEIIGAPSEEEPDEVPQKASHRGLLGGLYDYAWSGVSRVGAGTHDIQEANPVVRSLDDCQKYVLGDAQAAAPQDHQMASQGNCELLPVEDLDSEKTIGVYFVRHAESTWNDYTASLTSMMFANKQPWLTDAHLSRKGIKGVLAVKDWLFGAPCSNSDQCLLAGTPLAQDRHRRVVFATSNLRRAILTTLIAFWDRVRPEATNPIEKIHTLSSMQEMVTNIDSTPVTPPQELPYLTFGHGNCPFSKQDMRGLFATECHIQDENSASDDRRRDILKDFCNWSARQIVATDATDLVLVGHSIWIRKFFQRFLATQSASTKTETGITSELYKMSNEAVLKFNLKFDRNGACQIVPATTEFVRGGMRKRFGLVR